VCTVLLRLSPGGERPVLLGAIRDEFADRAWDPPARHWAGAWSHLIGGRDHAAGGTWLAVDPGQRAVAALLNAGRRDPLPDGLPRPTRGTLATRILVEGELPTLDTYDCFHLLRATLEGAELWSWDGEQATHQTLEAGDHIIVNAGLDTDADPLVPHFAPLLAATAPTREAWLELLTGDGLATDDERALVVRKEIEGRTYASTSATFVALSADAVDYAFTATPADPSSWYDIEL
jgi:uncharacterized protein with NRDE domain